MAIKVSYTLVGENFDTIYRLKPNPDAEPECGYEYGGVLELNNGDEWDGYFFMPLEVLRDLHVALGKILEEVDKKNDPR